MMNRRFLNLIVQDLSTRTNSLYLIDPWKHLFYPSTGKTEAEVVHAEPENQKRGALINPLKLLHKPRFRFGSDLRENPMHYFSALLQESWLLLADSTHTPFLYDIDLNSEMPIPTMNFPKGPNCVSFSTPHPHPYYPLHTHCLYLLDLSPATAANSIGPSFEVLNYFSNDHFCTQPQLSPSYNNGYYWHSLPQPPLAGDACSSIMVGGLTRCVSSAVEEGVGSTYTFDMLAKAWTRHEWVLPFHGKAEYVPELDLYFVLSADSPHRRLCAFNCTTATLPTGPPTLRHTFDCLDHLPEKWSPYKSHLVNLGQGSFCIVSLCENMRRRFAVFTGVEVKPCDDNGDGPLRMIKHLSKRYSLGSHSMCVL